MAENKYIMRMSLNVLNHLGLRLYSNIPTVLSEIVANAYDADATEVKITLDIDNDVIIIEDDGHGMNLEEINDKFLYVGYSKREDGNAITPKFKRRVMGRKGIGKLSLFSIANKVDIYTAKKDKLTGEIQRNALRMDRFKIEDEITKADVYHPEDLPLGNFKKEYGTKIIITHFKRQINYTGPWLRKRLARRFSVIGSENNFQVLIDENPITIADRDFFSKVQFLWTIGKKDKHSFDEKDFIRIENLNGEIDGTSYKITGWIGTVDKPSHLEQDGINNNKISVICRGKMAQDDILDSFTEGGIYADYLIGEIQADFLDTDVEDDIATSSRQKIHESDPRYTALQAHVYKILKQIQKVWTAYRNELKEKNAVENAKAVHPSLENWYNSLVTDTRKQYAKELFATIESFHFDDTETDGRKKKDLYVQGIVAFEKLKLRDSLNELSKIKSADDLKLARIFADLNDLEANLYYDIAFERVEVIKEFQKKLDSNDKEKLLQDYLFDNLWLLHPSWERPTEGTEIMERKVEGEFDKIVESLTEEERKGRMDIKYRTAAGKHIIIELKRYNPSYKITPIKLYEQMSKYRKGLMKCLKTTSRADAPIDCIAILGVAMSDNDQEEANSLLKNINGRIIYYDELIEQSLKSYSDYLDRQKEVSKLRKIIDDIIGV